MKRVSESEKVSKDNSTSIAVGENTSVEGPQLTCGQCEHMIMFYHCIKN